MAKLAKIIIRTPMSTADAERKFSSMKRIKSQLRSRICNNRLNAFGIFSMEKTLVNEKVKVGKSDFPEKLYSILLGKKLKDEFFY